MTNLESESQNEIKNENQPQGLSKNDQILISIIAFVVMLILAALSFMGGEYGQSILESIKNS